MSFYKLNKGNDGRQKSANKRGKTNKGRCRRARGENEKKKSIFVLNAGPVTFSKKKNALRDLSNLKGAASS